MEDVLAGWGERVREEREVRRWSQRYLADLVGVADSTITRIETGKLNPNDELKFKLSGAFQERMDRMWAFPSIVPPRPEGLAA